MAPRHPLYTPDTIEEDSGVESAAAPQVRPAPAMKIVWRNVFLMGYLHLAAVYGLYLVPSSKHSIWLWTLAVYVMTALVITAHHMWRHRSMKEIPFGRPLVLLGRELRGFLSLLHPPLYSLAQDHLDREQLCSSSWD